MAVYTLGIWTAKPGEEDAFVAGWKEFATATKTDFPEATAMLLRDRDEPNVFISFGPWESLDQIEQWRGSEMFKSGIGKIRAALESFEAHTMDVAVEIR